MKMRRMMVIVAVLAVVTWLAIPAVRIWRDPSVKNHDHTYRSKGSRPLVFGGSHLTANVFRVRHRRSFWTTYRELLLTGRTIDPDRCPGHRSGEAQFQEWPEDTPLPSVFNLNGWGNYVEGTEIFIAQ